jgi:hypothetical protein
LKLHRFDLIVDRGELPNATSGKRCAKGKQQAEAAIEPAANPKVQKRHEGNPQCGGMN